MAMECGAIVCILAVMTLIFWRRQHIKWVWATIPLMLVPLTYIITDYLLMEVFLFGISVPAESIVLIAAVGISCVWLGLVSNGFKNKRTRVSYIIIANAFNVALAAILSYRIIAGLPPESA